MLKEGASALYGSDALSGVVNFATRRNFEGLDLSAAHEAIEDVGNSRFYVWRPLGESNPCYWDENPVS